MQNTMSPQPDRIVETITGTIVADGPRETHAHSVWWTLVTDNGARHRVVLPLHCEPSYHAAPGDRLKLVGWWRMKRWADGYCRTFSAHVNVEIVVETAQGDVAA
jgi:hypothetical protein